jgi:xanthine dehydrogenase accessory factor
MKNILKKLSEQLKEKNPVALATIVCTRGSTPQVQGASAIFSFDGLVAGTLGGGILEADAQLRAAGALQDQESCLYDFELESDITSQEGAICGGSVTVLVDTCRENTCRIMEEYEQSARGQQPGVMLTFIGLHKQDKIEILRSWVTASGMDVPDNKLFVENFRKEVNRCLGNRDCLLLEEIDTEVFPGAERTMLFLQPVFPLPRLVIAGAGHIGQAVAHLGNLLDFEVTVVDDRTEYCNKERFPEADNLVVGDIGESIRQLAGGVAGDTYYVIVTRGHQNDAAALKNCIGSQAAYVGMIGSRTKTGLMKQQVLKEGWATQEQIDRLHAPIGINIHSKTVQEIAVSIAAQMVLVRQELNESKQSHQETSKDITAIILAAGASTRMGQPKLLLPFGDSTIIQTVIQNTVKSLVSNVVVVLGSHREEIMEKISGENISIADNPDFASGMLSSVQAGLRKLPAGTGAVMILLADQPMITQATIEKMADVYRHSDKGIVIAAHKGKRGHPIIFNRRYVEEILQPGHENSMHDFINKHHGEILEVETDTSEILRDIDTIADYEKELNYRR